MIIAKDFYFEAAHFIPNHNKCGQMHGHSYQLRVSCEGHVNVNGMVIDFSELKHIVNIYVVNLLDHKCLNEIQGLELPTAENICEWMKDRLTGRIPLKTIRLWETKDSYAELKN